MTPWSELSSDRQIQLREEYSRDPFCLTGTCSLEAKTANFTEWLARRGVEFRPEDLGLKPAKGTLRPATTAPTNRTAS